MKRPILPMFRQGRRVVVVFAAHHFTGKVAMASAKLSSLFIDLDGGGTLTVLGLPRPSKPARRKR